MQSNQLFAMFLKACGVEPKFKKQGNVYKTYSKTQKFIFDPVKQIVTYLKPITVFNGYEYSKDFVSEMFQVQENNGQLNIVRVA